MKLYLDFDNVIANSSEIIVDLLNENYHTNKKYIDLKKYDFSDLFPVCTYRDIENYFNSEELFKRIKLYDGLIDCLDEIKDSLDSIEIVTIGEKKNIEYKKEWVSNNLNHIATLHPIINNGNNDKSSIDMSDGIFIDDHIDCLRSSNAKVKILFKNENDGEWNKVSPNDDVYVFDNWYDLKDSLKFIIKNKEIYN